MKISKLFHWLYATLMFLPFIFFVPTLIYYGFNEHALAETKTVQEPIYYESNVVTSNDDLIEGNIYEFNATNMNFVNTSYMYVSDFVLTGNYLTASDVAYLPTPYVTFSSNRANLRDEIDGQVYMFSYTNNALFYFVYNGFASYNSEVLQYISFTDYKLVKDYQPITYSMSITDSVGVAWSSIWTLPLFSWTSNSFISQPFTYITGLFGMQPTNTFNNVATYFVTISICWLVFDLLMYVPNLAHRWLDRGAIQ